MADFREVAAAASWELTVATGDKNHYVTPDVIPLLHGVQGDDRAIAMWLVPRGKGKIIGLTLGHNDDEWKDPVFRGLLKQAVSHLLGPQ